MRTSLSFILISIFLLTACRQEVQRTLPDTSSQSKKNDIALLKMNNYIAKRNQELISQFVKRTGLNAKETGSGLWIEIYEEGKGNRVNKGDIVVLSYYLRLLDGTPIDSALTISPKSFKSGKGGVESGLEEGVLLLNVGDKARLIIPPHLAYGNFGNDNKIPPGAFLFYDLYLIGVNP